VDCQEGDLEMLGHHSICDAITDVHVEHYSESTTTDPLPNLPNLRSMTVASDDIVEDINIDINALPKLHRFPLTLQELLLEDYCPAPTVDALNSLTRLTSLSLSITWGDQLPCMSLTILSALRKLEIRCPWSRFPPFGELRQLTHLIWHPVLGYDHEIDSATLTELQSLVHLGIEPTWHTSYKVWVTQLEWFRHIGKITTLKSLRIQGFSTPWGFPAVEAATALGSLSLTRLALACSCIDFSSLSRGTLEGLQDVTLSEAGSLRQEGLCALGRVTGLTRLEISPAGGRFEDPGFVPGDLCRVISRMSRLQALSITTSGLPGISCSGFVGPLTGLTYLLWYGDSVTDADVAACLGLRRLRTLRFFIDWRGHPLAGAASGPISLDVVLELAKLPDLTLLHLPHIGSREPGVSLDHVVDEINPLLNSKSYSRGWPLENYQEVALEKA
jgi:hypothetical protein